MGYFNFFFESQFPKMTLWLFLLAILSILEGFPYIPNMIQKKVLKSSFFPHKQKQHIRFANREQKYQFLRQQIQALLQEQNEKEYLSKKQLWDQKKEYGQEKRKTGAKKISLIENTQSQFQDKYERNKKQYEKNEREFLHLKHKILGLKKQLKLAKQ